MSNMVRIKKFIESLNKEHNSVVKSYLSLRRCIGMLGIMLPLINISGGWLISHTPVRASISGYYYTNMRDFFVGMLCVVSLFLFTYKGYNKIDNIITSTAGIFGLGVAIFPCANEELALQKAGIFQLSMHMSDTLHIISAATFLTLLALISLVLFTMTERERPMTKQKRRRNIAYIICGVVILASLVGVALCAVLITSEVREKYRVTLILETFALISFGVSWLIKGDTLLKDKIREPLKEKSPAAVR